MYIKVLRSHDLGVLKGALRIGALSVQAIRGF